MTNPSVLIVTTHFAPTRHLGLSVGALFVAMAAGGIVVPLIISKAANNIQDNIITIGYGVFVGLCGAIGSLFYASPNKTDSKRSSILTSIEWRLLLRPDFLLASCGSSVVLVCALNFYRVAPVMAEGFGDGEGSYSAKVLAIFNGADLVSRFLACWVGDWTVSLTMY